MSPITVARRVPLARATRGTPGGRNLRAVQVKSRYREAIEAGTVTLIFRRWTSRQVVAGRVYRTSAGRLEVLAIDEVDPAAITDEEAVRAGAADADAVRRDLATGPGRTTYRIEVRPLLGPDPRAELAAADDLTDDDVAEIDRRLDVLDEASSHGPWTTEVLRLIEAQPATLAADLAFSLGRERDPFKLDVRKLKRLGLTESLSIGYRISPRGRAYLDRTARAGPRAGRAPSLAPTGADRGPTSTGSSP